MKPAETIIDEAIGCEQNGEEIVAALRAHGWHLVSHPVIEDREEESDLLFAASRTLRTMTVHVDDKKLKYNVLIHKEYILRSGNGSELEVMNRKLTQKVGQMIMEIISA